MRQTLRAIGLVILFWWVATGVIIVMQHDEVTRFVGLVFATVLAVVGVAEIRAVRDDVSPLGIRRAFLGGAMLWAWVSASFYGGYITGIHPAGPVAAAPSWAAVWPAISATLVNDAATLLILIGGIVLEHDAKNRTGIWTLALFWGVQQVAKLNVFFGVENPAANFLPPHLAYLRQFFGPPVNSPFLMASTVVVAVAMAWTAWAARRAQSDGRREAATIYATILGLAVLELIVLGVTLESTPWDSFLRARGS
jgi:putative photosynthetic complex assembly protein 2